MQKIEMSNCLSDVDLKLSQINVMFSEINQKMSRSPVLVQSKMLLPRVNFILSEIKQFVSLTQDCCDEEEPSNASTSFNLEWDNNYNQYYNLYYYDSSTVEDDDYNVPRHEDSEYDRHAAHYEDRGCSVPVQDVGDHPVPV